jgi:iron complex outermembrane receptor protein
LSTPLTQTLSATLGWRRTKLENSIVSTTSHHLDDRLKAGSFGLVLRPIKGLRLFLRADENFRFATVEEHTNIVFGQPVGIENQTGLSQEAGIEWQRLGLSAKALLYRLTVDDEISFDNTGFINTNLERTRRKGVIVEARWKTSPRLTLSGSFTYTDPKITAGAFDGNRIPLVSSRSARLGLDWQATEQWQLFAEGILRSDRVFGGDFANAFETLPGYGLLNLGSRYQAGPWRLNLRIDNLLDKVYASSGSVGYDSSFTPREAYFPAPERSLWLSARYQFE